MTYNLPCCTSLSEQGEVFEPRRLNYEHIKPPVVYWKLFFQTSSAAGHPYSFVGGYCIALTALILNLWHSWSVVGFQYCVSWLQWKQGAGAGEYFFFRILSFLLGLSAKELRPWGFARSICHVSSAQIFPALFHPVVMLCRVGYNTASVWVGAWGLLYMLGACSADSHSLMEAVSQMAELLVPWAQSPKHSNYAPCHRSCIWKRGKGRKHKVCAYQRGSFR